MVPQSTLRMMYIALVQSVITYGISVWGGIYKSNKRPLLIIQKSFIRVILRAGHMQPSGPLFERLQILNLEALHRLYCCNAVFKYRKQLNLTISQTVRAYLKFTQPLVRLTLSLNSFYYQGPKLFNFIRVPATLTQDRDVKKFIKCSIRNI